MKAREPRRRRGETKKQFDTRVSYEKVVYPKKQYVRNKLAIGSVSSVVWLLSATTSAVSPSCT